VNKSAGIAILFRAFVIEERAKASWKWRSQGWGR